MSGVFLLVWVRGLLSGERISTECRNGVWRRTSGMMYGVLWGSISPFSTSHSLGASGVTSHSVCSAATSTFNCFGYHATSESLGTYFKLL